MVQSSQTVGTNLYICHMGCSRPREQWDADLDGRISGCGRECCTNRITRDSSKLGRKKKPNVNHYINSINNINLINDALHSGLFSP